jgi:tRNA nucleotidyltransferase/poly(A) polymerase
MHFSLDLPIFKEVAAAAAELGIPAYVVGGYVRDKLLDRPCKDIDFVCVGDGIALAEATAKRLDPKIKVSVFKNFGTAMFRWKDLELEFVGARKESYASHSRKPEVEPGTLEDDQNRRDFTINALAVDLEKGHYGEIIDSFGGLKDLEEGIIRTPTDPDVTFSDDPLRMMRAVRFATQLGFTIEQTTYDALSRNAHRIEIISYERIRDELNKIILAPKPSSGFKMLFDSGILEIIFPELTALQGVEVREGISHKDNFYHTLQVLDNLAPHTDNLYLRWSAMLHDIAKPPTKRFDKKSGWTFHGHEVVGSRMAKGIFKRFRLPLGEPLRYVQKMVFLHLRPISLTKENITDSAVRRLLFEAGDDIDDLMKLCKADITSKNKKKVERFLQNFELVEQKLEEIEEKDAVRNFQPPVSGEESMQHFGIKPSREVGLIKNAIKDAILDGDIPNEREAAWKLMEKLGKEHGLSPAK